MLFLLLSILSSVSIFMIFRLIEKRDVGNFPVIVINYLTAALLGYALNGRTNTGPGYFPAGCFALAVLIGILFILLFFVVARSSQKAGMAITTVAGKMSVIFPILFSILYDVHDTLSMLKASGILFALVGVLLTIYKKRTKLPEPAFIYLPVILFVGMGLVDSLVKLAQYEYLSNGNLSLFTAVLFSISAVSGLFACFLDKGRFRSLISMRALGWGILLGGVNFGSIFFLIKALNYAHQERGVMDSSVVFGINNIGIVTLSVILGMLLFREKLSALNQAGILVCVMATILLTYAGY
jgi:drug/metabolite transporter (DMT)-like permease